MITFQKVRLSSLTIVFHRNQFVMIEFKLNTPALRRLIDNEVHSTTTVQQSDYVRLLPHLFRNVIICLIFFTVGIKERLSFEKKKEVYSSSQDISSLKRHKTSIQTIKNVTIFLIRLGEYYIYPYTAQKLQTQYNI